MPRRSPAPRSIRADAPPRQVVLVLQGGGALGAYQAGVYEALHEAGVEPDWVIGTSIGAINGALIAGNARGDRMARLHAFWDGVERPSAAIAPALAAWPGWDAWLHNAGVVTGGIPSFFVPNPLATLAPRADVGIARAAYYDTAPLRDTLGALVDFAHIGRRQVQLTVGAVNALSGAMRYFDSRDEPLAVEHVMASGALPPAFPAVRIGDDWFWDGGIYSNTPIEAVLDDRPRHSSLVFAVNVWRPDGPVPRSIWDVLGRQKDIQYASRADSHIERQRQLHRLRHVIRQLQGRLSPSLLADPEVAGLCAWGCSTTMHVVRLTAPRLPDEDHTKDIDFSTRGLRERWAAGVADARAVIARAPWRAPVDPIEGVVVHEAGRAGG